MGFTQGCSRFNPFVFSTVRVFQFLYRTGVAKVAVEVFVDVDECQGRTTSVLGKLPTFISISIEDFIKLVVYILISIKLKR